MSRHLGDYIPITVQMFPNMIKGALIRLRCGSKKVCYTTSEALRGPEGHREPQPVIYRNNLSKLGRTVLGDSRDLTRETDAGATTRHI